MSTIVKAIIDGVDLYEEFGIYVKTKDLAFPLPKTNYVEVEGADGSLDLSTALTAGEVKYHDREIVFTLTGLKDVQKTRRDIASLLHGKTVKLTFSDDLGYFYEGRLWVETWTYLTSISEFEVYGKMKPFRFPNVETVFNIPVKGEAEITLENDTDFRITPRVEVSNIPKNLQEVSFSWTGNANSSTSVGKNLEGTTLITNLATNPSFEGSGGAVEVWRNLCRNPNLGTYPYYWESQNGLFTQSRLDPEPGSDFAFIRYTKNPSGTSNIIGGSRSADGNAHAFLESDTEYFASVLVRASAAHTIRIVLNFRDGSTNLGDSGSTTVSLEAGVWTLVKVSGVAPAGTTQGGVRALTWTSAWVEGETLDMTRVMISTAEIPYFDGDTNTNPDPDLVPSWTGTVNNSASVLAAKRLAGGPAMVPYNGQNLIQSKRWSKSGDSSGRIITTGTFNQDLVMLVYEQPTGDKLHYNVTLRTDKELTVLILTGSGGVRTEVLNGEKTFSGAFDVTSGSVYEVLYVSVAESYDGETTVPAKVGESLWIDNFLYSFSGYAGPYFDGNSPNYLTSGNVWFPKTDYPMSLTDLQRRYFLHEGNNITAFSLPPNSSQKVKLSGSGDVVISYRKKYL